MNPSTLRAAFKAIDTDDSGSISREEFINVMQRGKGPQVQGAEDAKRTVDKIFADFDKDKNGLLNYDEFVEWHTRKHGGGKDSKDPIAAIKAVGLPSTLRDALALQFKALLDSLSAVADQLKAVGGDRLKLTVQYQAAERANEEKLNRLPYEACKAATAAGMDAEMNLHDALTLLKGKNFLGFLLEALEKADGTHRCVWASADLDNFKTVNDRWSHAHGDFALILACRAIANACDKWNQENAKVGLAVPMRFGGDEIVLAFVLRGDASADLCRPLLDEVHAATCKTLQDRFDFGGLNPRPTDREGKPINAKGPAISIGLSTALECGKAGVQFEKGFKRADGLLNEYKPKWKAGEERGKRVGGGGVIFEDDLLSAAGGEASRHISILKDAGASGKVKEKAAAALRNLSLNADNKVAIAKAGGLPPLIKLLGDGTPVGKEKAAAALKNLSGSPEIKKQLIQLGCPASALS